MLLVSLAFSPGNCRAPRASSITLEIFSPDGSDVPELNPQSMRAIPAGGAQVASERGVPYAPDSTIDDEALTWEHSETQSFLSKALSSDPRLKPSDVSAP